MANRCEDDRELTPGALKPSGAMDWERLEDKAAYRAVVEVRLASAGCDASVGLKPSGLDISLSDGQVLHYDLEGRLARVATPNVQWRRGLSHRTVRLSKRPRAQGGGLASRVLEREFSDRLVEETHQRVRDVQAGLLAGNGVWRRGSADDERLVGELTDLLARAAGFNARAARQDLQRFAELYGEIPILPPDQYGSLVLLATEGCVYNQCTFCGFYRDVPYRQKSVDEFRAHVEAAIAYHGAALAARRSVFLGQANALVGPREWREKILQVLPEHLEFATNDAECRSPRWWLGSPQRMADVASFVDAFTGVRITASEYARLRNLHLRRLYLGVESGDEELLAWLKKPASPQLLQDAVGAAKQGGLRVGVVILVGAGGERFFESHIERTVALLKTMPLGVGDYIYLSPLVDMPDTEYVPRSQAGGVEPLSAERMREQEQRLRAGFAAAQGGERPYVARYDVSHFVY